MIPSPSDTDLFGSSGFLIPKMSGNSMRPLIWSGAHRVVVVPLVGDPTVGDILMFSQKLPGGRERNIVHRLVEIRHDADRTLYITRGDNCLGCEIIEREDIIGRVAEIHRVGGYRPWYAVGARRFTMEDTACLRYTRFWIATWIPRRFYFRVRRRLQILRAGLLAPLLKKRGKK